MGVPILSKTWQFSVNNTIRGQGLALLTAQQVAFTIKKALVSFGTNPWTVIGSSNGSTGSSTSNMTGTDLWATAANIDIVGTGGKHSWIVLQQAGIANKYQILIDFPAPSSLASDGYITISPSAGFGVANGGTNGSTSAPPTATDEITMINSANWLSQKDVTHQVHVMQSTDGYCTRVIVWNGSTNLCLLWIMDKPQNSSSGWTNPSITTIHAATSGYAPAGYANLSHSGASKSIGIAGATITLMYTGECDSNGLLANNAAPGIGTASNYIDGYWLFSPIGMYSTTASNIGRLGNFFDLWWKPSGIVDGNTFPNSSSNRQFVAFGLLIFPWTNDSTIPLIV